MCLSPKNHFFPILKICEVKQTLALRNPQSFSQYPQPILSGVDAETLLKKTSLIELEDDSGESDGNWEGTVERDITTNVLKEEHKGQEQPTHETTNTPHFIIIYQ